MSSVSDNRIDHQPPRSLLGVWAHPDDEAYLSAGLMAHTIDAGGSVTVVTATRGEKGTDDLDRFGTDAFALFREAELRSSLAELGVHDVRVLGYRDGRCASASDAPAVATLAAIIDEVRPDTIVTFGPDGITNHPDHQTVSRWTTFAWGHTRSADLLYATMTHDFVAEHARRHAQLGLFDECPNGAPFSVDVDDVALVHRLTENELDRKRRALAAHASQTTGLAALVGESAYRSWWRDETFRRPTRSESTAALGSRRSRATALVAP